MLTLLASIAGFASSILPEVFKFCRDRHEKAYLLKMMDKKIENNQNHILIKQLECEIEERKILHEEIMKGKTDSFISILNASVRPILAYGFFILYCVMKYMEYKMISKHIASEIFEIWNENDQAVFAGIISFYFGQRTLSKMRTKK